MRANFRASSSFFLRNFVRTKLVMCLEFSSPANDVSNLTSFDIGYVGMAGSNLHLFQRFLGTKVGRMATSRFPVLRRVEARTAERRLVTFRGSSGSPKAGPTLLLPKQLQLCVQSLPLRGKLLVQHVMVGMLLCKAQTEESVGLVAVLEREASWSHFR